MKEAETADVRRKASVRQGDPADAIFDVSEERGASLITGQNQSMTYAKRILLGSVTNEVSRHGLRSVMIMRKT